MEISNMDIQMFCLIFGISFCGFLCSLLSLLIIYKKPTLHNAFGYICAAHSFAEAIILFCFSFWSAPIILLDKDIGNSTFGIILGPLMNYLLYGSMYFQSIKSLNRVFAIMFFSQYRKLFTVENVKIIVLFVAIIAFFHIIPSFFYECNFYFNAFEYVWKVREDSCANTTFLYVDFGTGSITMSISIICDCVTFVYLLSRKKSSQENSSTSFSREIKFFIQTCLTSLFYATMFVSWHFVSRRLTSVWGGFLSTTLVWQLCHALNQVCFILFNVKFNKGKTTVQLMSVASDMPKTTRIPTSISETVADSAFYFVNSEEHVDFAQPITHKIIYMGGLGKIQAKPLEKQYTDIFDSAKKGVILFSFGSAVQSFMMKPEMKKSFLEAFAEFPEIYFIWKYEKDEHHIAKGYKNVFTGKWLPQNDILDHPKLLAFISHGGMNSVMEGATKGVPMICIPVFGDQTRNSLLLERRGTAIKIDKSEITKESLVAAIKEIISNDNYRKNAQMLSKMVNAKPTKSEERIIKYAEFAAQLGSSKNRSDPNSDPIQ